MYTQSKILEQHEVKVLATVSTLMEPKTIHHRDNSQENLKQEKKITKNCDVMDELSDKLLQISFGEPRDTTSRAFPPITSSRQFKNEVSFLCNEVFHVLGPYNLEATYQRALALELQDRGVTVLSEVEIPIQYKGQRIATRRVDLYLKFDNPVIIELKAVVTGLKTEHLKQLKFYMTQFHVSEGYLINFPHITGFPIEEDNKTEYIEHVIQPEDGIGVSDRVMRSFAPRKNMIPTIIHVQQLKATRRRKTTAKKKTSVTRKTMTVFS